MKVLIFRRKLARLSFLIMCMLCSYAVYMLYMLTSQNTDTMIDLSRRDGSKLYGPNYPFNGKRLQQSQTTKKQHIRQREVINAGDVEKRSESSFEARVDDHDDSFIHEYPLSFVSSMKDETLNIHEYMDVEFTQNLLDIHEMDAASVGALNSPAFRGTGVKENPRDFHYPEVGYRYFGVLKGSQNIPGYKQTSQQTNDNTNLSVNLHPASVHNPGKYLTTRNVTKTHSASSKIRAVNKAPKTKIPFSNLLPPSPVNDSRNQSSERRYLVYLCDAKSLCGGWGDRQRGIVSTYILSRMVNRQLKIIMTTPCHLRFFYKPNKVQWLPDSHELITHSNITINAMLDKDFQYSIKDGDFNLKYPQKVIYLKTNQDYFFGLTKNPTYSSLLHQWGGLYARRSRFHWAWSDLMQPSHMLLTHLEYIVGSQFLIRKKLISKATNVRSANSSTAIGNSTLICAHARIGKNPTNPMDSSLDSFSIEHLPTLLKFMSSQNTRGDAKFFVATDYERIRAEAKQYFGDRLLDYGGQILHIDRQRSEQKACAGFEVALIDQFILSLCDILIVCKSGFSMNASYMRNGTEHLYYMKDGKIQQIND